MIQANNETLEALLNSGYLFGFSTCVLITMDFNRPYEAAYFHNIPNSIQFPTTLYSWEAN